MKNLCILLMLLFFISCKEEKNEEISFILLEDFTLDEERIINGRKIKYYGENYVVSNYYKSEYNTSKLDSFACTRFNARKDNYHTYQLTFYKYSKKTNNEELKKNQRELARYSDMHDMLFIHKFLGWGDKYGKVRYKMHKASIVEKSDFICED